MLGLAPVYLILWTLMVASALHCCGDRDTRPMVLSCN